MKPLLGFLLAVGVAFQQPSALRIVVIEGEGAVNIIQQKTAVSPLVEVRDRNDQPVSGAIVNFVVRNGRATFSGARTISVTTNAAGRAVATGFAPSGSGALQIGATATFQGQTAAAVTIAQTNVMTAAEAAAASAGASAGGSGGTSGGASAAGGSAGSGGGVSATVLGVVSAAAVAGGAVAATSGSDEEAPAHVLPPVFGADAADVIEIRFSSAMFGPTCTSIQQNQLGLTLRLDSVDGPPTGTFDVGVSTVATPGTCPSNEDSNFRNSFQVSGRVSGSRDNLVATATLTAPFTTIRATGQTTHEFVLNGRLVDDQVSGILVHTHTNRFRNTVIGDDGLGTGEARTDVVFRKVR